MQENSEEFNPNIFEKFSSWIVFFFTLIIYLAFPTKNYYWDGIGFAGIIEAAPELNSTLFHPNHLFYNVVGFIAFQAAKSLGWQIRAIDVLQILNCIFGALSAVVFFRILKSLFRSRYLSLVLTLFFAFSATWWKFSTDADAYVPSVLFLLISFYLLLPSRAPRPFLIALTHSFAMFFHQLAIFFFPVIILGLFLQNASVEFQKRVALVLKYGLTAFALTFGTFCFSFYLLTGGFDTGNFVRWLTFYTPDIGFVFNAAKSFSLTVQGNTRLFVDGRFNFLVLNPFTTVLAIILIISLLVLIFKIIRNPKDVITVFQTVREPEFYKHPVTLLAVTWILPYLVFLFFFIPGNTFYRLFYFPALILLIGLFLNSTGVFKTDRRQWRAMLLVVVIGLANFLFFIRPYSQVRQNTPLALALEMNHLWNEKTVVYYDFLSSDSNLVKYFNPSTTWKPLNSITTAELETELQNIYANGNTVWVETTAIDKLNSAPETAQWLKENLNEQRKFRLTDPAYNMKIYQILPNSSGTKNINSSGVNFSGFRFKMREFFLKEV